MIAPRRAPEPGAHAPHRRPARRIASALAGLALVGVLGVSLAGGAQGSRASETFGAAAVLGEPGPVTPGAERTSGAGLALPGDAAAAGAGAAAGTAGGGASRPGSATAGTASVPASGATAGAESGEPDDDSAPAHADDIVVSPGSGSSGTASAASTLDAAGVAGLRPQRIWAPVAGAPVSAHWTYLAGDAPVNAEIESWVRAQLDDHATRYAGLPAWKPVAAAPPGGMTDRGCERGSTYESPATLAAASTQPRTADGETILLVSCDVVSAGGDAIGIRMRASEVANRSGVAVVLRDEVATFYADRTTGNWASGSQLFTGEGGERLMERVRAAVAQDPRASASLVLATRPLDGAKWQAALEDVAFASDGGARVRVEEHAAADSPGVEAAPVVVDIPADVVAGALTDFGREIVAAAVSHEPWRGVSNPIGLDRTPCDLVACLALTFDDGPGESTARMLDTLRARDAAATFFVVGKNVDARPEVVAQAVRDGNEIGNHTYDHIYFAVTPTDQIVDQVRRTDDAVFRAANVRTTFLRPPWATFRYDQAAATGKPVALWGLDSRDWEDPGTSVIVSRVASAATPGMIVLMHDTHTGTVDAMGPLVDSLRAQGYSLVTLSTLGVGNVGPGDAFNSARAATP